MYLAPSDEPRKVHPLATQGVEIPAPKRFENTDTRSTWVKLMPLFMVLVIGVFIAMWVLTGSRAIGSLLFALPMMLMMGFMYARGGTGNDDSEIESEIEEYDLALRERRREIYAQGEALHNLRTLCFPHPADLLSLVGGKTMWQASPNKDLHRVVADDIIAKGEDPYAANYTGNPWLRARVGIGVAPLYPRLQRPKDVLVPELLEPATMVRYKRAMSTLSVVANLPIDVNLGEFPAYALRGDEAARLELARSMAMSLAFNHSPSILNIGVITDDPASWEWMKWLPHLEDTSRVEKDLGPRMLTWRSMDDFAASHAAVIERMRDGGDGRPPHLLLIVDTPESVVSWPASVPGGVDGLTLLAVRYATDLVSEERSRILITDNDRVLTIQDPDAATRDRISIGTAEAFARAMHRFRPEGYGTEGAAKDNRPAHVPDFFEALGIGDIETHDILKVWERNAYTDEIKVPFGYLRRGDEVLPEISYVNFYEENRKGHGPHGAIQGRTGSGKSYMLTSIVLGLVSNYGPDKVALILADFKGGSTFIGMDDLPHVVANISNLENTAELADRLGEVLSGEVERRMKFITVDHRMKDIFAYREEQQRRAGDPDWPAIPDLIVIIDEFGEFLAKNKDYVKVLDHVGRVGRSLGVHMVMCSQSIEKNLLSEMWNQLTFRYSLAVNDPRYSRDLIGTEDASSASMSGGELRGKILRKFNSDPTPVEVVSFRHEDAYVRRTLTQRARSAGARSEYSVSDAVIPFNLFDDRGFTVIDGEVVETRETATSAKMGALLLDKIRSLQMDKVLELWLTPLREPITLSSSAGSLTRMTRGLSIRIGDLDDAFHHRRLPWYLDLGGSQPHQVIAGAPRSGRTTLLQTLVVSGALTHEPERLAFLLADCASGKLAEVAESPNVAAYARPGDEETLSRVLGEARRLIALRREEMVSRRISSVEGYLDSKATAPVPGDPYGYVIVAIDGIGGFYGEDLDARLERSRLLRPIIDQGASVGVHLIYTADSMESGTSGNLPHHSVKLSAGIQLPTGDTTSLTRISPELRSRFPAWTGQPGRSVVSYTTETGAARTLEARTMVPIPVDIEPSSIEEGMRMYRVEEYTEQITHLCRQLAGSFAGRQVTPVSAVPAEITFDAVWREFAPLVDADRNPAATLFPVGVRTDTFALQLLTGGSRQQNLLVYGEKSSGRSNALRMMMTTVMRQFTPDQAMFIMIDPLRQFLADRDRLWASGYLNRPVFSEPDENGERRKTSPGGYVVDEDDIETVVKMLVAMMKSRMPKDDTSGEALLDRSFITGPEIYVFIDNINALLRGSQSVFNPVGENDTLARLIDRGQDLGVHFIVSDDVRFPDHVEGSAFLSALRHKMGAPILQLSAPSAASPVQGAPHLKPRRRRPGLAQLILDADNYTMVQTPIVGPF